MNAARILEDDLFLQLNELLIASWTEPRAKSDFVSMKKANGVTNRDIQATGRIWVKEGRAVYVKKPKGAL